MDKVVIAIDSFKGSLTAQAACAAAAKAVQEKYPECEVVEMPMSDGGDGLTDVLVCQLHGQVHNIKVVDPLMRDIEVKFGAVEGCAIIEMAAAAGLTLLDDAERNPMKTTTYGVGMMIRSAIDLGYKKLLIGLGGSATTDAGLGALQALGLRCFNSQGRLIKEPITGSMLVDITHIDPSALKRVFNGVEVKVVCDVQTPFCGHNGAAMVFSPQKGASDAEVQMLDAGLRSVAHVIRRTTSVAVDTIRGAGAAGGFGGTLAALAGAEMVMGTDAVMSMLHFGSRIQNANLVITGEGKIDKQSLMGKVVGVVIQKVHELRIPILAIAGKVENKKELMARGVLDVLEITPSSTDIKHQMLPEVAERNIYNALTEWLKFEYVEALTNAIEEK